MACGVQQLSINMDETAIVRHASARQAELCDLHGRHHARRRGAAQTAPNSAPVAGARIGGTPCQCACLEAEVGVELPRVHAAVFVCTCEIAGECDKREVLLLDVAQCHLDASIVAHAKRCGVRLCFLPGHMTGDLQPCDTHLFSKFKAAFREKWRRQKAASANGFVTTQQWLKTVSSTIASVLPTTSWQQAFEATGVLAQQRRLSTNLCQRRGRCNFGGAREKKRCAT